MFLVSSTLDCVPQIITWFLRLWLGMYRLECWDNENDINDGYYDPEQMMVFILMMMITIMTMDVIQWLW